jgi:RHS repeat-associated protein
VAEPQPATGEEALPGEDGELQVQGVIGEPDDLVKMNPYRYGGYRYDRETQYYYLRARNYDGRLARFLSQDTLLGDVRRPLTLNRYIYATNSPVDYLDPTGHKECTGAITCSGVGEHTIPDPKAPSLADKADEALVRAHKFTDEAIRYYKVSRLKLAVKQRVSEEIVVKANNQAHLGLNLGLSSPNERFPKRPHLNDQTDAEGTCTLPELRVPSVFW